MVSPDKNPPAFEILTGKLRAPCDAGQAVDRPRLLARLNDGQSRSLTLVSAPAGAGKTTLACAWLRASGAPYAWVTLDAGDDQLLAFLYYLCTAVETIRPGTCGRSLALLQAAAPPDPTVFATILANDLDKIVESYVLVLDDYHVLRSPAIHTVVARLVEYRPGGLHLVVLSREDPPLPLARLRARQQVAELRAADLTFTPAEAAALLRKSVGQDLSDAIVAVLTERTEGWAAGLQLAALSLCGAADSTALISSFHGTSRNVMDYLMDEVLSAQPPDVQDFLLRTSILDRFCAPLCGALARDGRSLEYYEEMVAHLERANLFVVALDRGAGWYRYTRLFREMLYHRLELRATAGQIVQLHDRAAAWLVERGLIDEGLRHALVGDNPVAAAVIVEGKRHAALNREDWRALMRWLHVLPAEMIDSRPGLLMAQAWVCFHHSKWKAMHRLLAQAQALLPQADSTPGADAVALAEEIALLRGLDIMLQGHYAEGRAIARRALLVLPRDWIYARWLAAVCVAGHGWGSARSEEEMRVFEDAFTGGPDSPVLHALALDWLAQSHWRAGRLDECAQMAQAELQCALAEGLGARAAAAYRFLGYVAYERNDVDQALCCCVEALALSDAANPPALQDAWMLTALSHLARGDQPAAQEAAGAVRDLAQVIGNADNGALVISFLARVALYLGARGRSPEELPAGPRRFPPTPCGIELPGVTAARILLCRGTREALREAAEILLSQRRQAELEHITPYLVQILAVTALVDDAACRPVRGLDNLQQALALAERGRFVRSFIDLGLPMRRLLLQVPGSSGAGAYAQRVLAAFPIGDAAQTAPCDDADRPGLFEFLTDRETEVLRLMSRRLSDKEIAAQLVISPATANRHALNIYRKLDVHGRRQAVARAQELGLIPPPLS